MNLNRIVWKILWVLVLLLLGACRPASRVEPTPEPMAVYTSAAQTVAVQLTQRAQTNPSATSTETPTLPPTTIPTLAQGTPTSAATTAAAPTNTQTVPVSEDRVEFLDQTPGDGSVITPLTTFKVSWRIRNVGKSTWTTGYSVRFFSGSRIGANLPNSYTFTRDVPPGDTYIVTIDFQTGADAGDFQSNWVLTNQKGNNFYPLYISIRVGQPTATVTPTPTSTTAATAETTTP